MQAEELLRPRPGSVIAETIGDETLVIDTESGCFYDLRGVGSALWVLLEHGAAPADLVSAIEDRYPHAVGVAAAVDGFLAVLEADGVIARDVSDPPDPTSRVTVAWPSDYVEPVVEKHDDVADLLLVDPLHDVDEAGWPHRAS